MWGQPQSHKCSLQNMRMRSEHLDISTEGTVMVEEDTARLSYRGCNVLTCKNQVLGNKIGTAVKTEDGRGRLQVCYGS